MAEGIILGTPNLGDVTARGTIPTADVIAALAHALSEEGGNAPFEAPTRALVATARA